MPHEDESPSQTPTPAWRVSVDTGGTFTDCVAQSRSGEFVRFKTLSSGALRARVIEINDAGAVRIEADWLAGAPGIQGFRARRIGAQDGGAVVASCAPDGTLSLPDGNAPEFGVGDVVEFWTGEPAPIIGARLITRTPFPQPLPPMRLRLATTRGTNALLERTHAPTAFLVTEGFADLLEIGDQRRPELFALDIRKPRPLHAVSLEVRERMSAEGETLIDLDEASVRRAITEMKSRGITCAAVALAHSWRRPEHEERIGAMLRREGIEHISLSSDLSRAPKLLPRARTAVVNAGLSPILQEYCESISRAAPDADIEIMTSAGGLKPLRAFRPVNGLLSGPAGGVIGAAEAGRRAGAERVISFDMGGTSTDVARIDGQPDLTFEHTVGDATLLAPAVRIETVAAGGGSICGFDGDRPFVGPRSAGADPGPACYGAGGPLTVTDVNLLLGRLDPSRFGVPLNVEAAERAFDAVLRQSEVRAESADVRTALLHGFLDLANEHMAQAIRRISVRAGYDPAKYALVAFGGAGPQHACAVAERLGVSLVIIPPDASLLSACGVHMAPQERIAERTCLTPLPPDADVARELDDLVTAAQRELSQAASSGAVSAQRLVELRLVGQSFAITIDWDQQSSLTDLFLARHEATFGFAPEDPHIELVALRAIVRVKEAASDALPHEFERPSTAHAAPPFAIPTIDRSTLSSAGDIRGPALITEAHSVTVVETGWSASAGGAGEIRLRRDGAANAFEEGRRPETVRLELIAHRLDAIAEQMGATLQHAALSTNVKERLDFSCAVLSPRGEVVASAPHIPVHLGALGHCVRRLLETIALERGDVVVTNHPGFGGSHLPDVTVVAPVHDDDGALLGFTASRAHHAEIGGVRPGSMPPDATTLAEEGVVLPPTHLVRAGVTDWRTITSMLTDAPHPTRALRENRSDLAAALAAARHAERALRALATEFSTGDLAKAMDRVLDRTDEAVRAWCAGAAPLSITVKDQLDDGAAIRASIKVGSNQVAIDFTGSAATHPGNLNAPLAVVHSAVAYVMRLLIQTPVPINDGLLRGVRLIVPEGMLNPRFPDDPALCPAVAGGNVETSQRLVSALLRALSDSADSQSTMNNVIIGDASFSYYETLAGGAGATARARGADAVHTHMTNTAITDPETFETRYPVRIRQTRLRRGSGGSGAHRGGDGLVREFEFTRELDLSVLTQNRVRGARGADRGGDGAPGAQRIIRADGEVVELRAIDGARVQAGDRFIIETPGGGGWGQSPA